MVIYPGTIRKTSPTKTNPRLGRACHTRLVHELSEGLLATSYVCHQEYHSNVLGTVGTFHLEYISGAPFFFLI